MRIIDSYEVEMDMLMEELRKRPSVRRDLRFSENVKQKVKKQMSHSDKL